jgi:hypothetical protein
MEGLLLEMDAIVELSVNLNMPLIEEPEYV